MSDESGAQPEDEQFPQPNAEPETPQAEVKPIENDLPWARITVRQVDDKGRLQITREYFPNGQGSPDHAAHSIVFDLCQYLEKELVKQPEQVAQESIKEYTGPRRLDAKPV